MNLETKLKIQDVRRVARIYLTQEQEERCQKMLDSILPWFKEMLSIELPEGITPIYSLTAECEGFNCFEGEPEMGGSVADVLFNAPEKKENLILVPKVI